MDDRNRLFILTLTPAEFAYLLDQLQPQDWDRETPAEGWSLRAKLLGNGTERAVAAAASSGYEPHREGDPDWMAEFPF